MRYRYFFYHAYILQVNNVYTPIGRGFQRFAGQPPPHRYQVTFGPASLMSRSCAVDISYMSRICLVPIKDGDMYGKPWKQEDDTYGTWVVLTRYRYAPGHLQIPPFVIELLLEALLAPGLFCTGHAHLL